MKLNLRINMYIAWLQKLGFLTKIINLALITKMEIKVIIMLKI